MTSLLLFRNSVRLHRNLPRLTNGVGGRVVVATAVPGAKRGFFCSSGTRKDDTFKKIPETNFDRLRNEIHSNGFISAKLFEKLAVGTPKRPLTNENALLLISTCAHFLPSTSFADKINAFHKMWNQLRADVTLTKDHYLSALEVFRFNRFPLADYQKMLKESGLELDAEMYEGLIALACEHGNVAEATDILTIMRDKQHPITENVFSSLIIGYSRSNDLRNCETVVDTMRAANMEPGHKTFTALIQAFIENEASTKALQLLTQQKGLLQADELVAIIRSASRKGYGDITKQAISQLPADMVNVTEVPDKIRDICTELVFAGKVDDAFLIVDQFPSPKFNENQDVDRFGRWVLFDCIRTQQPSTKVIAMCKRLIETAKNPRALHVATEISLRRDTANSLEYLKALSEIDELRPHYFWPLIHYWVEQKGEVGVINVLAEMTKLKVSVDYETMASYVFPRLSLTCKNVKETIVMLENAGLQSSQILTPFIASLIPQQRFDDIGWILHSYQSKIETDRLIRPLTNIAANVRATKNLKGYANMIAVLQGKSVSPKADVAGEILLEIIGNNRKMANRAAIVSLLDEFKMAGVKISSEAFDTVQLFLGKNDKSGASLKEMVNRELNLKQSDKLGVHPRDMTLDELENHLIELENKGMNSRGVLRRILQLAVREGKYVRALEIHKKCTDLKVQRSPGMVASVLEMYVRLAMVDAATRTMQELRKEYPGFVLDEHKVIDYATLLVKNGKIEEAKSILKQRAASTKIMGGDYVNKNLWELLNAMAHQSAKSDPTCEENQTRGMLDYLNALGYCTFNNIHLGCVLREYLLKQQIVQAVAEYLRIAEQYRKTPLQLELMNELVRLSSMPGNERYQSLLEDVIRETSKIHGPLNTNINLILALAQSGTSGQLRKLLIDPQFRFNADNLIKNCEHLSNAGRINVLLTLARASRGLGHVIKEQDLYNILLNSFVRENNFMSAIELFEKIEADDELKISQDFVRNVVDLLKRNNVEIPSNIALRAQVMV